ncbi:endonuclease [Escherichia coli]|uniref:phosphorothioated DNA-binding restriction endonuclease n=1 Tax=Escherichia coli TaxID=562 RepID=UPI0012C2373F|nr:HNH endonuclease [Escherichia coli]MEB7133810.1 HNH endonuclease [Escherichia coli]MQK38285.1 HNH endonuclease [Escherichia coli]NVL97329.1 HNH endonuclease [Escherichia coli]QLQ57665.1 HNH endonuclease [Escherichia coli]BBP36477.1 endonuclease [Escherichia coli]
MTSDKTLKQAISNITIWRKGEQRAPHKPLLLLYVLSHYRQGHGRMFNYGSEIYEPLLDLLERYGPQRRDQRPDMPFWRLKGDGFWELHNAELCSTSGSRQPPRRELIEYNVAGGFDADNFALVAKNHRLIDTLAQQLLEAHFPASIQEEIADEMGFDIRTSLRQRDPKFRQMVLRAYNYQCAICGFNMRHDNAPIALEAAHIRWKQHHGPCEVPNGLALCAIHHKAFDRGSIGLDENMRVVVSGAVNGGGVVQRLGDDANLLI